MISRGVVTNLLQCELYLSRPIDIAFLPVDVSSIVNLAIHARDLRVRSHELDIDRSPSKMAAHTEVRDSGLKSISNASDLAFDEYNYIQ